MNKSVEELKTNKLHNVWVTTSLNASQSVVVVNLDEPRQVSCYLVVFYLYCDTYKIRMHWN